MIDNPFGVYAAGWRVLHASAAHVWAYLAVLLCFSVIDGVLTVLEPVVLTTLFRLFSSVISVWLLGVMTVVFTAAALGRPTPWLLRGVGPGRVFAVLLRLLLLGVVCSFFLGFAGGIIGPTGLLDFEDPMSLTFFVRFYAFGAVSMLVALALAMPLALGIPAVTLRKNRRDRSVGIERRWRMLSRMAVRILVAMVPVAIAVGLLSLGNFSFLLADGSLSGGLTILPISLEVVLTSMGVALVSAVALTCGHAMFAAVLADGYIAGGGRFPSDDPSLAETFA